jgi:hypothetical protein
VSIIALDFECYSAGLENRLFLRKAFHVTKEFGHIPPYEPVLLERDASF